MMAKEEKELAEVGLEELEKALDGKQKMFAHEYIIDWAKARSYMKAYPDSSYEAAAVSANRLLKNAKIIEYIELIKNDFEKEAGISKLMVLREHQKLAFSSISHLHNTWIERKEFEKLTDDQKDCISEIDTKVFKKNIGDSEALESVDVEHIKVKLYDKQKSLVEIGKLLGYNLAEKIDHTSKGEKIQQITGIEVK